MSTEENDPVSVPTDQPLLSKDTGAIEIDIEVEKEENLEKKGSPVKTESDPNTTVPNDLPKDAKCSTTPPLNPSTGTEQNDNKTDANEQAMAKSQSEIHVSVTNSLSVSQTSKNSLMTFSSSGTFYDHATSKKKGDLRITPKKVSHTNGKDTTDFRQMEQGLLQLLEDFHSGKLEAFGQDCTFDKMENVREQQEKLARLHFDLNTQQELCGQNTDEGITMSKQNLSKLTENLQELSCSIEELQSASPVTQADI